MVSGIQHPGEILKQASAVQGTIRTIVAHQIALASKCSNQIVSGKRPMQEDHTSPFGRSFRIPSESFLNLQTWGDLTLPELRVGELVCALPTGFNSTRPHGQERVRRNRQGCPRWLTPVTDTT